MFAYACSVCDFDGICCGSQVTSSWPAREVSYKKGNNVSEELAYGARVVRMDIERLSDKLLDNKQ